MSRAAQVLTAWRSRARALSWPGSLGGLALLLALALALVAQRWDAEALRSAARAQALSERLQRAAPPALGAGESAPLSPQQWQAELPPAQQRQQRLADLLEMSLRAGLSGSRTEHRLSVDAAAGLERLRVTMPVAGGYAQLRRFIAGALRHDPALSLDSLRLRRASPTAPELEAELQWSLHGRAEAGAQAPEAAR